MSTAEQQTVAVLVEEQVKKRSESKLQFEVGYIGENIMSSLATFAMAKDPRTEKLQELLAQAYTESMNLKNGVFKA